MKNKNQIDKLSLKDLYTLSNDKGLNNYARGYISEQFRQRLFKYLKFGVIAFIIAFGIVSIIMVNIRYVEANYTQSAKICNSEKCLTRFKYIEEAKTKHKSKEAIVQYTLIRTVFNRKNIPTVSEYRTIEQEISKLYDLTSRKVVHNGWSEDDKRQEILNKFVIEGEKQGVKNIKDMIGTFLGENGTMNMKLRSHLSYNRNGKKYWDFGACQISEYYHPEIVNDKRFFTDEDFQIEKCVGLYKGGTRFYGAKHKEKMKKYLTFNF